MPHVIVASRNPTKIDATRHGFEAMFPHITWIVEGHPISSGVSAQPIHDDETLRGARNRATRARADHPSADYWVGMEGGVEDTKLGMIERAWMVVLSRDGREGIGSSGAFILPPPIAQIIRNGKDLGDACDIVFAGTDCRKSNGAIGLLTGDVMQRTALYEHGMILALIPFKHELLYTP